MEMAKNLSLILNSCNLTIVLFLEKNHQKIIKKSIIFENFKFDKS